MDQPIDKIVDLIETKNFLATARQYCTYIELTDRKGKEFLLDIQHWILMLYQQATVLSWTTLEHDEAFTDMLPKDDFDNMLNNLADKIGAGRFYWEVFNPTDHQDHEVVCGDLVDDLGDIYKDIRYGLLIYDLGTTASREDAIWNFKFGFERHWGRHAISALKAIHFLLGMS